MLGKHYCKPIFLEPSAFVLVVLCILKAIRKPSCGCILEVSIIGCSGTCLKLQHLGSWGRRIMSLSPVYKGYKVNPCLTETEWESTVAGRKLLSVCIPCSVGRLHILGFGEGRKKPRVANYVMYPCLLLGKGKTWRYLSAAPKSLWSSVWQLLHSVEVILIMMILSNFAPETRFVPLLGSPILSSFEFQVKSIKMNSSSWWIRPKKDTRKLA